MQCDYFDSARCRSCSLMNTSYAAQLAEKQRRAERVVESVAPEVRWLEPQPSQESNFRNKAKLVVGGESGAVTLGILDGGGRGVDLRGCGLYERGLSRALSPLAEFVDGLRLEPYDVPARRGELKHLIVTHSPGGELMVRFVARSRKHETLLRKHLGRLQAAVPQVAVVSLNVQPTHKAVLEGELELVLTERTSLAMRVNDVTLHLRPRSFFQTNTAVAAALYRQAQTWLARSGPASVWDLYCGVGGFALHLAMDSPGRRVLGVEVSAEAVKSARVSAAELAASPGPHGDLTFRVGDAMHVDALDEPDAVVVNPPRRGLGAELIDRLETSGVPWLVYSSCNVDSLVRDLARLGSYQILEARLFDMFPQTTHHEVMVFLRRRRSA